MSAIHKRLHCAQRTEFKILKRVFGEFLPQQYPYQVQGASENVFKEDFDDSVDVIPVSDPNIFSDATYYVGSNSITNGTVLSAVT